MKIWQWILLISIAVAFLTLLASALFMPLAWEMAPMMGRGYGYWDGFYSPWGLSWLFASLRILFWLLPITAAALLATLLLNSQHRQEVAEPVDKS